MGEKLYVGEMEGERGGENQYTQLYVGEMEGERGGENQYTQLYVGEMEGERGERTSTHSCMLEILTERGGREAVCWRDGGREGGGGENKYTQLYVGETEGDRGER